MSGDIEIALPATERAKDRPEFEGLAGGSSWTKSILFVLALILLMGASANRALGRLGGLTIRIDWLTGAVAVFGLAWLRFSGRRLNWTLPSVLLAAFAIFQFSVSLLNVASWPSGLKFSTLYVLVLAVFLFLTTVFEDSSLASAGVFFLLAVGTVQALLGIGAVLWSHCLHQPTPFSIQHIDLLVPRAGIYFAEGTLIEPNVLGSFLLAPFAVALWLGYQQNSWSAKTAAHIILAGIVLTGTRAAWIPTCGIFFVWLVSRKKRILPLLSAAGTVAFGLLVLVMPMIRLQIMRGKFTLGSVPHDILLILTKNFSYRTPRNEGEFFTFHDTGKVRGFVEQAVDEESGHSVVDLGRKVLVSGWVVPYDPTDPVQRVEILLDRHTVGSTSLSVERSDIRDLLVREDALRSGWSFELDTSNLSEGIHFVRATAILRDGSVNKLSDVGLFDVMSPSGSRRRLMGRLEGGIVLLLSDYSLRVRGVVAREVLYSWSQDAKTKFFGQGAGSVNSLGKVRLSSSRAEAPLRAGELQDDRTEAPLWVGNVFLHLLHDSGIVGLLVFLAFLFALFGQGWRRVRGSQAPFHKGSPFALFLALLGILFSFQFTHAIWQTYFYAFASLLVARGDSLRLHSDPQTIFATAENRPPN